MEEKKKLTLQFGLTAEVLPALAAAEQTCFSDPWPLAAFETEMANPYCYYILAFVEEELAGYIGGVSLYESCDLNNVAVLPKYRRCGIGALLLEVFMEEAKNRGAEQVLLEVREHNDPAIALYTRHGFQAIGKRKNYYQNPAEDAVIMVVTLC